MAKNNDQTKKQSTAAESTSMVAEHPQEKQTAGAGLQPVEKMAEAAGLPGWECAALMHAAGWAPGKQVKQNEFDAALALFRKRSQGGGRI